MDAIQKAVYEVKFRINKEILELGFREKDPRINNLVSIDDRIASSVIRPKVVTDTNLVGGVEIMVDINKCTITNLSTREYIIEIPKSLTNGMPIMSALGIISNVMYARTTSYSQMPAVATAAMNMMDSMGTEDLVQTSRIEMLSENVILVADPSMHLMNGVLRCVIGNNPQMTNLNPRSYLSFAKLAVLATKAYIHNVMLIKMDKAIIYGGHELGIVKDVIDSYSDAINDYDEELHTVWPKVQFMNDDEKASRYIKAMLGNTM